MKKILLSFSLIILTFIVCAVTVQTIVIDRDTGLLYPTNVLNYTLTRLPTTLPSKNVTTNSLEYINHLAEANNNIYDVKYWFNVKGDGQYLYAQNQLIAAGSRDLTITNGSFTSSDVGKVIMIYGAGDTAIWGFTNIYTTLDGPVTNIVHGTNYHALTSIITNVLSSTQIQISNAAITTVNATTNVQQGNILYGTDDTDNLQTAYRWIFGNGGGTAFHPEGVYIVNGPIQDPGTNYVEYSYGSGISSGNRNHASQIYLQDLNVDNHMAVSLRLEGASKLVQNSLNFNVPYKYKVTSGGTIIASTLVAQTNGTVFSCENFTTPVFSSGQPQAYLYYNPVCIDMVNMTWRCPPDSRQTCVDLRGAVGYRIDNLRIDQGFHIDNANFTIWPTFSTSVGLQLPESNDQGEAFNVSSITIYSFYTGITPGEHGVFDRVFVAQANRGIWFTSGGHADSFAMLDLELCRTNIVGDAALQTVYINSSGEADETSSPSYPCIYVYNPGNAINGNIFYHRSRNSFTNVLIASPTSPTLNLIYMPNNTLSLGPVFQSKPNFSQGLIINPDDIVGTNSSSYNYEIIRNIGDGRHAAAFKFSNGSQHAGMSYGENMLQYPNGDNFINQRLGGGYQGGGETAIQLAWGALVDFLKATNTISLYSDTSLSSVSGNEVYLINSNKVIYGVSATKTNLISDLR